MTNQEIAEIFEKIANLLEIKGEVIYKTLAYRRAAESIRNLAEDINKLHQENKLSEIPGVGKAISEKIIEILTSGKLEFLEKLEKEVPPSLIEVLQVPDVGPKKAALFWREAGITNLTELEKAANTGELRQLPGMGEKSEKRILDGIKMYQRRSDRMLLGQAWQVANTWLDWLRSVPGVLRAEAGGSLNRWKPTIGDLDFVVSSNNPLEVMEAFVKHKEVNRILGHGENKSSIELQSRTQIQLWIQPPERFGSLWQYSTGSKEHNVHLREHAQRIGYSLSERGIQDALGKEILCADEADVYQTLGMPWIPPELREDRGEIQAALNRCLPTLLDPKGLISDLHMHSTWSDGRSSIEEMALAAKQKGLHLICICDHSASLGIARGLNKERLAEQRLEIDRVQQNVGKSLQILQGVELEILADGKLDFPDELLQDLDLVVASLHTSLRQPRETITGRLLMAIRNPHVDIIGHPSGRLLPNREGADLDWDIILQAAADHGVALEINSDPSRLDLDEIHARRAAEMGILMCINSDAHSFDALPITRFGISVARRAWVNPELVINTWPNEKILEWLGNRQVMA